MSGSREVVFRLFVAGFHIAELNSFSDNLCGFNGSGTGVKLGVFRFVLISRYAVWTSFSVDPALA